MAEVYRANKSHNAKEVFAIKVSAPRQTFSSLKSINLILVKEFNLMMQLRGEKNIVHVYEHFEQNQARIEFTKKDSRRRATDKSEFISMELCSKGNLLTLLNDHHDKIVRDHKFLKYLFFQICNGLHALHTVTEHAHLDIKADNILIGDDY